MSCTVFPYYQYSHRDWSELIQKRYSGEPITVFVPWGAHEPNRGVVDFSRSPRLNIERLVNQFHQLKKKVIIRFGFTDLRSIPGWLRTNSPSVLIPRLALGLACPRFTSVRVPDFDVPSFKEPFEAFVAEAFSLLNLYRSPEGPIVSFDFDPGIYGCILSLPGQESFSQHLASRYSDCRLFNEIFGTNFTSIDVSRYYSCLSKLMERRHWVACYDLRAAHRSRIEAWSKQLFLPDRRLSEGSRERPTSGMSIEDECVVRVQGKLLPYFPEGLLYSTIVSSFARCQQTSRAWDDSTAVVSLERQQPVHAVYCDKFIRRDVLERLVQLSQQGPSILFVPTFPVYDENMAILKFTHCRMESCRVDRSSFWRVSVDNGVFWAPRERHPNPPERVPKSPSPTA